MIEYILCTFLVFTRNFIYKRLVFFCIHSYQGPRVGVKWFMVSEGLGASAVGIAQLPPNTHSPGAGLAATLAFPLNLQRSNSNRKGLSQASQIIPCTFLALSANSPHHQQSATPAPEQPHKANKANLSVCESISVSSIGSFVSWFTFHIQVISYDLFH